jgi:hypothetical protein
LGLPFGQAGTERRNRLSPVQGLDLTFLIHAKHNRLIWR